jgi:cytidylate kinase
MPSSRKKPVIVLDGPAGAGKSSVAKELARRLGLPFLDSGAIYRAITLVMLQEKIPAQDSLELDEKLRSFSISFKNDRVIACGEDVTEAIRTPEIDKEVSAYSALPAVRNSLLDIQRSGKSEGLVAEGRDMGTVVFPDADLKIFLTADPETRARRRYDERIANGRSSDYLEILKDVIRRDEMDSSRETAPLRRADGAVYLDTTSYSFGQVVDRILEHASRL